MPVLQPIAVEIVPEISAQRHRLEPELLGLAAALLEAALGDLPEVAPAVRGGPPAPSVEDAFGVARNRWTVMLAVDSTSSDPVVRVRACGPRSACTELSEPMSFEAGADSIARVAAAVGAALGRPPPIGTLTAWTQPLSADRYAAVLCGRAAARRVGLLPEIPRELWGDRYRDAFARALAVDPDMALGHWLSFRRELAAGRISHARASLERMYARDPRRVLFALDGAVGVPGSEWSVLGPTAYEARFRVARARAALAAGDPAQARTALQQLPEGWDDTIPVIVLRVRIAERDARPGELAALLARWQERAPQDPEPIRGLISLRLREARYDDALALVNALRTADDAPAARPVAVALAAAADQFELASRWAADDGDPELAGQLRARHEIQVGPKGTIPPSLASMRGAPAALARARQHLDAGRFDAALRELDPVRQGPLLPDALALRAAALGGLGRAPDRERVLVALRRLDPGLLDQGPRTAAGNTGEGVQVQSPPP